MSRKKILLIFFISAAVQAQDRPYLIPQIVYVGDRATLVLPLHAAMETSTAIVSNLYSSPDIDLYRIVLERRPSGSRLMIDFSAYTPGLLELPPIEIGGETFTGLGVEISSILGPGEGGAVLSGPASPLAVPGTSLLVYGTMGLITLFLLLVLWVLFWGRRRLAGWLEKWKRRQLIISMWNIEKRLRKNLAKGGNRQDILNALSSEFRVFLSLFTGQNYRAMTAGEMEHIAPPHTDAETEGKTAGALSGGFLGAFFGRCDGLRFSGAEIAGNDILAALGDLRLFLQGLEKAGKNNQTGAAA
jgi:hypothetical protein